MATRCDTTVLQTSDNTAQLTTAVQFLDMITQAQDPTSTAYADLTAFISAHLERAELRRARLNAQPRKHKMTPDKGTPNRPLLELVKKATKDSPPVYKPIDRPLPKEKLTGVRHIPRLATQMTGMPFVRLHEPVSKAMSRRIERGGLRHIERVGHLLFLHRTERDFAAMEDKWEDTVRRAMVAEGLDKKPRAWARRPALPREDGSQYAHWVDDKMGALQDLLDKRREDNTARATALVELIEQEKELAIKEAIEDGRPLPKRRKDRVGVQDKWPWVFGHGR